MLSIRKILALLVFGVFAACAAPETIAAPEAWLTPANPVLDRTGDRIALDVSSSDGGVERRSILVVPTRSGSPTHQFTADQPSNTPASMPK